MFGWSSAAMAPGACKSPLSIQQCANCDRILDSGIDREQTRISSSPSVYLLWLDGTLFDLRDRDELPCLLGAPSQRQTFPCSVFVVLLKEQGKYRDHNVYFLPSCISYNEDIECCEIVGTIRSFRHFPENESCVLIPR